MLNFLFSHRIVLLFALAAAWIAVEVIEPLRELLVLLAGCCIAAGAMFEYERKPPRAFDHVSPPRI
jgi:hypothetical protein